MHNPEEHILRKIDTGRDLTTEELKLKELLKSIKNDIEKRI
jgi:hypothetical protein